MICLLKEVQHYVTAFTLETSNPTQAVEFYILS